MGIEINGIAQLMNRLNRISSTATTEAVMAGIEKGCLRVERDAKIKAPLDTGILRASITHKLDAGTLSGTVFTNIEYAAVQEFGGQHQDAQPYLYPALASNVDKIKADIIESLKNEIRGV